VKAAIVNHEVIILDASSSMLTHASNVVKVTDALIQQLASQAGMHPDQETRITVYAFSSENYLDGRAYQCLIWDKDVLRVPSIAGIYKPHGNTALLATIMQVIEDIKAIPVQYGDHAVLMYVVTDGYENWSEYQGNIGLEQWQHKTVQLPGKILSLPGTWTMAAMVPGLAAKRALQNWGFHQGNIEIWDPSRQDAMDEVGRSLSVSATAYAGMRASGQAGTSNLFSMNAPTIGTIASVLTPMTPGSYYFEDVTADDLAQIENGRIDQFMQLKTGTPYAPGRAYYQMIKRERIQHYKTLAINVRERRVIGKHSSGYTDPGVYVGKEIRHLLGLPSDGHSEVRISPPKAQGYDVYILSTSMNRKVYPGTKVLVMR
jgi:hypothetical protein